MIDHIPERIRNFILEKITSVSQLEILLLLYSDPSFAGTAEAISRELRSNASFVTKQLAQLHEDKFLSKVSGEEAYRFEPATAEHADLVRALAELYREQRVAIISLIYDKPSERIKGLADAFKIRRDENDS